MKIFCSKFVVYFLIFFLSFVSAFALSPENRLSDEVQEARARGLFLQVRCVVCGGQIIESSDSSFSFQMRQLIREKILAGKNDKQIKKELIKEFGADILVNPTAASHSGLALIIITLLLVATSTIFFVKFFTKKS